MTHTNVLYPSGSTNLLKGNFHLCTSQAGEISGTAVALMKNTYIYSGQEEYYAPIASHDAKHPETLSGITCVTGTLAGNSVTFSAVPAGNTITSIVVFQSGAVGGTAPTAGVSADDGNDYLLAYYDRTAADTAISIVTNDGDITINWNALGLLNISGGC